MPKLFPMLVLCLFSLGTTQLIHAAQPISFQGKDLVTASDVRLELANAVGPTVVTFVSARCPCSISHEATLKELAKEFKEARFLAIHSNSDETMQETSAHFAATHFPFPIIQDEGAKIANGLGAFKTPHAFVYDKSGNIVYQGGVDDSHETSQAKQHPLKDALLALRAGKKPIIDRTRSLGCIIRR